MATLYRIIDDDTNTIVANALPTWTFAEETKFFLEQDNPCTHYVIESYSHTLVRGMGRDPDLHT